MEIPMGTLFKTALCATAMTLASVSFAQAQDAALGAKALGQIDGATHQITTMIDECVATDSTSRAVLACTKLMRLTADSDVKASLMTQRALHRVAQGNHKSASVDFARAAALSNDSSLYALADGFESVARNDFAMAQSRFEDCQAQGTYAAVAEYGLGLTSAMANGTAAPRSVFQ